MVRNMIAKAELGCLKYHFLLAGVRLYGDKNRRVMLVADACDYCFAGSFALSLSG